MTALATMRVQETTISARLRDLRKEGLIVELRHVKGNKGQWEYRLSMPTPTELRKHGEELAHSPAWGPSPPAWHTAATQADWEAEAVLTETTAIEYDEDMEHYVQVIAPHDDYQAFLTAKAQLGNQRGFTPIWMPDFLFDFQRYLTTWQLQQGRGALLVDCGLGKSPMELVWAENVVRHANKPVLLLTPLAVAQQMVKEGEKFGIDCHRSKDGRFKSGARIIVTNYERIEKFNPADFAGVVCDESSAIKSFDGVRKAQVTEFMRLVPYRLLATATAAPNDYIELGTSSEALGELGYMDMLNRFFRNDNNTSDTRKLIRHAPSHGGPKSAGWRFKGHAEEAFWRWVCSWARACRKPSDLGFSDEKFILPPMEEREHIVETKTLAEGMLFALPARNFREERDERRRTIQERCELAAELAQHDKPVVLWCHLNKEGDLLERLIPDARQISGATSDDEKEELYEAFSNGQLRALVTKPKIGAWGLNWQHCAHVITFASHSWEQYYQAVRRCWRFGQKSTVTVDLIASEGEQGIKENLQRKARQADRMFSSLVDHMNNAMRIDAAADHTTKVEMPQWL